MSIEIGFGTSDKRTNSTAIPDIDVYYDCRLKDSVSWHTPTFLLNIPRSKFDYNVAQWGSWYYFVEDVTQVRNDLIEVHCRLDALATYKREILNNTVYVSYSSVSGGQWLPDTRIPVLQSVQTAKNEVQLPIFNTVGGWYITSVIGKEGCDLYALNASQIIRLTHQLQEDAAGMIVETLQNLDFSTTETALQSLTEVLTNNDILGNAYSNAPACVRSCSWVPFVIPSTLGESEIYLGNFATGITAPRVAASPFTGSVSVQIPWQNTDWRRGYCEDVYLYLPLVGMVGVSSASLVNESALTINYSYTVTDGAVAFQIIAGNQVIGSYGGSCSANYPIGINQKTSAGDIINTFVNGIDRTFATALSAGLDLPGVAAGLMEGYATTSYQIANAAFSTHPSCVGGIGGGAGFGLSKNVICFTVYHQTIMQPAEMSETMGMPTMKPIRLSTCSGYTQCANAHISCSADLEARNVIDSMVNSGFFIE